MREEIRRVVEELCKPMSPKEQAETRRMTEELMKPSVRKKRKAEYGAQLPTVPPCFAARI
jgi:hypothetical protein